MYDQIREDFFFILFYGGVTTMAMIASCYQGQRGQAHRDVQGEIIFQWL